MITFDVSRPSSRHYKNTVVAQYNDVTYMLHFVPGNGTVHVWLYLYGDYTKRVHLGYYLVATSTFVGAGHHMHWRDAKQAARYILHNYFANKADAGRETCEQLEINLEDIINVQTD